MQGGRTPQSQGIIPRAVAKVLKMNSLHQVLQLFSKTRHAKLEADAAS